MKQLIQRAEEIADFTIVLPPNGRRIPPHPTQGQIDTYHQMIEWGADVVFGGHPHVIEPTETITKDGEKKFIIYSMGNLLSNQRVETLENIWTERGVIMDITIEKETVRRPSQALRLIQHGFHELKSTAALWKDLLRLSSLSAENYIPGRTFRTYRRQRNARENSIRLYRSKRTIKCKI